MAALGLPFAPACADLARSDERLPWGVLGRETIDDLGAPPSAGIPSESWGLYLRAVRLRSRTSRSSSSTGTIRHAPRPLQVKMRTLTLGWESEIGVAVALAAGLSDAPPGNTWTAPVSGFEQCDRGMSSCKFGGPRDRGHPIRLDRGLRGMGAGARRGRIRPRHRRPTRKGRLNRLRRSNDFLILGL